jgi:septum formation protein
MMLQQPLPRLLLASASPARRAMLDAAGVIFQAQPARVDEAGLKLAARAENASADETALLLAEMKARRLNAPDALVIGADQLLVCGDRWFDKPKDEAEARAHLKALRGRTHTLVTAVVCVRDGARIWHHLAHPRLTMRDFSDDVLEAYLATEGDRVLASVGAYRVEGPGIQLFEAIEGEHSAILGLPLLPLLGFLRQHGVLS